MGVPTPQCQKEKPCPVRLYKVHTPMGRRAPSFVVFFSFFLLHMHTYKGYPYMVALTFQSPCRLGRAPVTWRLYLLVVAGTVAPTQGTRIVR